MAILISLAALLISAAQISLIVWALKMSRDADFNSRVLDAELHELRGRLQSRDFAKRAESTTGNVSSLIVGHKAPENFRPPPIQATAALQAKPMKDCPMPDEPIDPVIRQLRKDIAAYCVLLAKTSRKVDRVLQEIEDRERQAGLLWPMIEPIN